MCVWRLIQPPTQLPFHQADRARCQQGVAAQDMITGGDVIPWIPVLSGGDWLHSCTRSVCNCVTWSWSIYRGQGGTSKAVHRGIVCQYIRLFAHGFESQYECRHVVTSTIGGAPDHREPPPCLPPLLNPETVERKIIVTNWFAQSDESLLLHAVVKLCQRISA